ncbi:hypothetical protein FB451DRAFT_1047420, partial [Mycena latifolia]
LPLPASADASKFTQFGREVFGVDPANLTSEQFGEIREALYKHDVLVFRNAALTPKQQYALTKVTCLQAIVYPPLTRGTRRSILHRRRTDTRSASRSHSSAPSYRSPVCPPQGAPARSREGLLGGVTL